MNLVEKDMSLCICEIRRKKESKRKKIKGRKGSNWKISRTQGAYSMSISSDLTALWSHIFFLISRKKYRNFNIVRTLSPSPSLCWLAASLLDPQKGFKGLTGGLDPIVTNKHSGRPN